jgi:16S rRNA (uracil1498-N3)-methyltransferase
VTRGGRRRFFVEPGTVAGDAVAIDGPLAHRLAAVLRLRAGDGVVLFDGSGEDVQVRLDEVGDRRVLGTVLERAAGPREAPTRVHLYQSITKGERFEWLVEKATELGVARIVPLVTARAVVRTPGGGNRLERWRRIAVEAAEQCGRSAVPAVEAPAPFAAVLSEAPGIVLLPYEAADHLAPNIQAVLQERIDELYAESAVSILIGPEGGLEPVEAEQATAAGAQVVTLGERILRAETAGLVALTLVMQACGELG